MSKLTSANTNLTITQAVTLLAFGEYLDGNALARRHGCYRSPESPDPDGPHIEEDAAKIEAAAKSICEAGASGAINIVGRPGHTTYGDRYPECFGDYTVIPKEVFIGAPQLYVGWPPFPIIQAGDNIHHAPWFFPMVKECDIAALRKKLFQIDLSLGPVKRALPRAAASAVKQLTQRYVDAKRTTGEALTQLGLEKFSRAEGLHASREHLRTELSHHVVVKRGRPKKSPR